MPLVGRPAQPLLLAAVPAAILRLALGVAAAPRAGDHHGPGPVLAGVTLPPAVCASRAGWACGVDGSSLLQAWVQQGPEDHWVGQPEELDTPGLQETQSPLGPGWVEQPEEQDTPDLQDTRSLLGPELWAELHHAGRGLQPQDALTPLGPEHWAQQPEAGGTPAPQGALNPFGPEPMEEPGAEELEAEDFPDLESTQSPLGPEHRAQQPEAGDTPGPQGTPSALGPEQRPLRPELPVAVGQPSPVLGPGGREEAPLPEDPAEHGEEDELSQGGAQGEFEGGAEGGAPGGAEEGATAEPKEELMAEPIEEPREEPREEHGGADDGAEGGADDEAEVPDDSFDEAEWDAAEPRTPMPSITFSTAGKENLCMDGHFVPEFILIGVVKAATTSFAADLRESSGMLWPVKKSRCKMPEGFCHGNRTKEGHFFDKHAREGLDYMTSSYPACRHDVRMVATEASPRYFMDPHVPAKIASVYGPRSMYRLKFIVILRDPIARFQSDYWHARDKGWCESYNNMTFNRLVRTIVTGGAKPYLGGTHFCHDRLEGSLYTASLTNWFGTFAPSQFVVVPFLFNVAPGVDGRPNTTVVELMWSLLGVEQGKVRVGTVFNVHEHPPLSEDLKPKYLELFRHYIWKENSPTDIASVLVRMSGSTLFGYTGNRFDRDAIAEWLEHNW